MSEYILSQLEFARKMTLQIVDQLTEHDADVIPQGFNNNIRWNLGHIYTAQERLVFHFAGEPMLLPKEYPKLFGMGSKPSEWEVKPPALDELRDKLYEQTHRIGSTLAKRLREGVAPYTTSAGLTLSTIGEFATFTLYHEGMHFSTIKTYKRLLRL